ncbi:MAG: hypothetical protein ACREBQ_03820, partial [Nitrososphaerales archaeon]
TQLTRLRQLTVEIIVAVTLNFTIFDIWGGTFLFQCRFRLFPLRNTLRNRRIDGVLGHVQQWSMFPVQANGKTPRDETALRKRLFIILRASCKFSLWFRRL